MTLVMLAPFMFAPFAFTPFMLTPIAAAISIPLVTVIRLRTICDNRCRLIDTCRFYIDCRRRTIDDRWRVIGGRTD
jgi:hypothetical protein